MFYPPLSSYRVLADPRSMTSQPCTEVTFRHEMAGKVTAAVQRYAE
jgi:hypothetical protein